MYQFNVFFLNGKMDEILMLVPNQNTQILIHKSSVSVLPAFKFHFSMFSSYEMV